MFRRMIWPALALVLASNVLSTKSNLDAAQDERDATNQQQVVARKPEMTDEQRKVAALFTALNLAEYGRREQVPEALLTAARIFATTHIEQPEAKATKEPAGESSHTTTAKDLVQESLGLSQFVPEEQWPHLLSLAITILDIIDKSPSAPIRGTKAFFSVSVPPGGSYEQTLDCAGGITVATVQSLNKADMDVIVRATPTGSDLGSDTSSNPHAQVFASHPGPAKLVFIVRNASDIAGQCNVYIQ